jgi:hypothetical protein
MTVRERFFDSALRLEDAVADGGDVIAARRSFVFAAKRWVTSEGWVPPGSPMTSPEASSAREQAMSSALAYADADSENDVLYEVAHSTLVMATLQWLRCEGWTHPTLTSMQEAA